MIVFGATLFVAVPYLVEARDIRDLEELKIGRRIVRNSPLGFVYEYQCESTPILSFNPKGCSVHYFGRGHHCLVVLAGLTCSRSMLLLIG